MEDFQPGQVITPNGSDPKQPAAGAPPEPEHPMPTEEPENPVPTPAPTPEPTAPAATTPEPDNADTSATGADWQFRQEGSGSSQEQQQLPDDVSWSASEFIDHEKSPGWYGLLAVVGLAAAALDYLLTRDVVSTSVIVITAVIFGAYATRKPRVQQYRLDPQGLQIGEKQYGFHDFKTFSVSEEGAIVSIVFMPLKRFLPPLTVYVAPDMEDTVLSYLSSFLPIEQHKVDAVESLLKRIRF